MSNTFIELLPDVIRHAVYLDLLQLGLCNEDLNNALNSRLCDLSDMININKYTIQGVFKC